MVFCPACGKENAAGATFCANCGKPLTATAATPMAGVLGMSGATGTPPAGMRHAEIVDRFIGTLIDVIILYIVTFIIAIPFGLLALSGLGFFIGPFILIYIVLFVLYFTYFEGTSGQTIGKRLAHIKVVDERSGTTVDMGRAFLRSLLRIIDGIPYPIYIIGLILVAVTPNRQRLGDMVAHTVVVKV